MRHEISEKMYDELDEYLVYNGYVRFGGCWLRKKDYNSPYDHTASGVVFFLLSKIEIMNNRLEELENGVR